MKEGALERMPLRSIERNPGLVLAAVYEREVDAGINSVWENVFDWEHLPWLHSQTFRSIALREEGDWGWHADVGFVGEAKAEIELVADRTASCYVARTRAGFGSPGEIWTRLESGSSTRTTVRVEFWTGPLPEEALAQLGEALHALYRGLWDQDEGMIKGRERAFAERAVRRALPAPEAAHVELGSWSALRSRLPLVVEVAGHRFRLVELDGRPVAHSVECPHWLGSLEACSVEGGEVTCPWHGYRFDVRTGTSTDRRGLGLRPAPVVEIDRESGLVRLFPRKMGEPRSRV